MRPLPFVLASTDHGAMILNVLDANQYGAGVGAQIMATGAYERDEQAMLARWCDLRRQSHGDGVVFIDAGANIGAMTVTMAQHMTGWGSVIAIEAQERIFYALAGNVALANAFNVRCVWGALVGTVPETGMVPVPQPDYCVAGGYGSLEIYAGAENADLGQVPLVDAMTPAFKLDNPSLSRCDVLKLDIEGMELEVLAASDRILTSLRPVIWVETNKRGQERAIHELLEAKGYAIRQHGPMTAAVPKMPAPP